MTNIQLFAFVMLPISIGVAAWTIVLLTERWQSRHGADRNIALSLPQQETHGGLPAFLSELEPIKVFTFVVILAMSIGVTAAIFLLVTKSGP